MKHMAFLGLICLLAGPGAGARELISNGSFERGEKSPVGWAGSEGARWEEGGRTGKCAVLGPAPRPEAWVTWKQEIKDLKPDTTYEFTAWVKADQQAYAQVVIEGLKPHKQGVSFFYFKADTSWKLWKKDVVGDATSSPTVHVMLLNEGGHETFFFDDVSFKVRDEVDVAAEPVRKVPEVEAFREGGNLISNGEFEVGEGDRPGGWFHGDPGLMPRTGKGKYHFGPTQNTGQYTWETPAYQSERCVSVTVPAGDGWGGWDTQVHNIKPNTDYTLSFWVRMNAAASVRALVFGKEQKLRNYFDRVPWHWSSYSATVNSGSFPDDCNLGFVAESEGPGQAKLSIDRVQLFEGTSPIGKNMAWMYHYLYDFTWVSPDAVSPVAFAGEWQFTPDAQPPEIRYVVEIPKQVECIGVHVGRLRHAPPWGVLWNNPDDGARLEKLDAQIEGKDYVRYTARQTLLRQTDPKGFANECFVPVDWRGLANPNSRSCYCATNLLWLYLSGKQNSGDVPPAFYHCEWEGGKSPTKKLAFRVTSITPAPLPKRMVLISGHSPQASKLNPQFLKDYRRYGLNGLDGAAALVSDDTSGKGFVTAAQAVGMRYFSHWTNQPAFGSGDPEAKGAGIDGKRNTNNWCLEYRGHDWAKRMNDLKALLEKGVNTFLFDDTAPSTCYCDKCTAVFKEFLAKHSKLEFVDPLRIAFAGWTGHPDYRRLWDNFPLWHYGRAAAAMKQELIAHAKASNLSGKIHFGISSWLPCTDSVAAESLSCFDFNSQQTYLCTVPGTPKDAGDWALGEQKRLGPHALAYVPTISPGLTYWHCLSGLDPHAIMRDQILEMMMAAPKALGYTIYAGGDFDLGDMKYTAEANALLSRFEDIIVDGEVVEGVSARGTEQSSVRAKKLADEVLVLVGDYSTYEPVATEVSFTLRQAKALADVETGETLQAGDDGTFKLTLKGSRSRLFHAGPMKR